jgi:hypothetical protein
MRERVDRILAEYDGVGGRSTDAELDAVKAALFLESAFGIQLSDAEIDQTVLGDIDATRALVLHKLGAG